MHFSVPILLGGGGALSRVTNLAAPTISQFESNTRVH